MRCKILIKRKCFIVGMIGILCLTLMSCGKEKDIKKEAEKIADAVENNDRKTIAEMLMGTENFDVDEELADFFEDQETGENSVIDGIVERDTVEVKEVTDQYIIYEISAPELSGIFQEAMGEEALSEETFEDYILNYIATADETKIEVKVPYTYEDGMFTANYATEEFINGITGNLVTAYQELIGQMLEENKGEESE